jgi:hypothetical protein
VAAAPEAARIGDAVDERQHSRRRRRRPEGLQRRQLRDRACDVGCD